MKSLKEFLNENCHMVGFNVARMSMPQLNVDSFIKLIDRLDIEHRQDVGDLSIFKPTQKDFDQEKVTSFANKLLSSGKANKFPPILVSQDGFVLDGHHRYFGAIEAGVDFPYIVIDLPINKLLKLAIQFVEEISV